MGYFTYPQRQLVPQGGYWFRLAGLVPPANLVAPALAGIIAGNNFNLTPGTWNEPVTLLYDAFINNVQVLNQVTLAVLNATATGGGDTGLDAYVLEYATGVGGVSIAPSNTVEIGAPPPVNITPPVLAPLLAGELFDVTPGVWTGAASFLYSVYVDNILVLNHVTLAVVNATAAASGSGGLDVYVTEYVTGPGGLGDVDSNTEVIGFQPPANITPPALAAMLAGDLFAVTQGTWVDATSFLYDVYVDNVLILNHVALAVVNATASDAGDGGLDAYVTEFATGPGGANDEDSNTVVIGFQPPANVTPAVLAAITAGELFAVTAGTWNNAASYLYSLYVDNVLVLDHVSLATVNATASVPGDSGLDAFVREYATGPGGTVSEDSNTITIDGAPIITVPPVLTWTVVPGTSPAVVPPTYLGATGTITWTLKRDGVDVAGVVGVTQATLQAYVAVAVDTTAAAMLAEATVTNGFGSDAANSNSVSFVPTAVTDLLVWYNPATPPAGALSTWVDQINAINAVQATAGRQGSKSAAAFGGAFDGIIFNGTQNIVAPWGALVSGKTQLVSIFSFVATITSAFVILEQSVDAPANNGAWAVFQNSPGLAQINGRTRFGGGEGGRFASLTGTTKVVVAVGLQVTPLSGAAQIVFIRINGTAAGLTNQLNGSTTGSFASQDLYIGARGVTATVGLNGTLGNLIIRNNIAQDAALDALERYVGIKAGITW